MAKGKVTINITDKSYVFIDGATGDELTQEEFNRKYKQGGIGSILGANRVTLQSPETREGEEKA